MHEEIVSFVSDASFDKNLLTEYRSTHTAKAYKLLRKTLYQRGDGYYPVVYPAGTWITVLSSGNLDFITDKDFRQRFEVKP